MALITLFHGSDHIIQSPYYGAGNTNNDYGQGFYTTENVDLAKEWACRTGGGSFVNIYRLDTTGLRILDLNSDSYSALHWITILIENRKFAIFNPVMESSIIFLKSNYHIDIMKYDVIIGCRADDSYFSYARDFITNALSIESLNKAIRLGNLGVQYCIRSKKAFGRLEFLNYEEVDFEKYHSKALFREKVAREGYEDIRRIEGFKGTFISSLIETG